MRGVFTHTHWGVSSGFESQGWVHSRSTDGAAPPPVGSTAAVGAMSGGGGGGGGGGGRGWVRGSWRQDETSVNAGLGGGSISMFDGAKQEQEGHGGDKGEVGVGGGGSGSLDSICIIDEGVQWSYAAAAAGPPMRPARRRCVVTGLPARFNEKRTGQRFATRVAFEAAKERLLPFG